MEESQPEQPVATLPDDTAASPSADLQYSVDALFPPHWRGKLLDTKPLEALLRAGPAPVSVSAGVTAPFFEELQQQILRVSKTFNKAASKVSRAAAYLPSDGKQVSMWFWSKWRAFKVAGTDTVIPLTSNSVTEEAAWCYAYAQVNKSILERLLQQHDLLLGGDAGKHFYKDAHSVGEVSVLRPPSFLHSPWLEELLALQSRVSQQTNNRQAKEHARAMKRRIRLEHRAGSNGSQSDAQAAGHHDFEAKCPLPSSPGTASRPAASQAAAPPAAAAAAETPAGVPRNSIPPASEVRQRLDVSHDGADPLCKEDDLLCSICLDYFCQPVGLACGHVFCMSCLVDAMKGSVLLRPQVLPRQGRCPECRQQNVCRTCVELRELDKLVQLRHPKEHRAKLLDWEWRVHIALQGRFVYGRASVISAFPVAAMPL
ncbi:hypothetical protein WJX84_008334 [Apatococcus fuscideae]|uniref:RING-type domain-containing protein n=1 Tax=Apatococcus fuscideae TaxID=2026836 RepID=A0AAW1TBP0_9CHLO